MRTLTEEQLLTVLAALSSPHRLRLIKRLHRGPGYVSQLARDLHLGRPLLHMHLEKLQQAGLVRGHFELSPDGKALKVYQLQPFAFTLTPEMITEALAHAESTTPCDDDLATPPGAVS